MSMNNETKFEIGPMRPDQLRLFGVLLEWLKREVAFALVQKKRRAPAREVENALLAGQMAALEAFVLRVEEGDSTLDPDALRASIGQLVDVSLNFISTSADPREPFRVLN